MSTLKQTSSSRSFIVFKSFCKSRIYVDFLGNSKNIDSRYSGYSIEIIIDGVIPTQARPTQARRLRPDDSGQAISGPCQLRPIPTQALVSHLRPIPTQARPNSGPSQLRPIITQAQLSQLRPIPTQAWPTQARPTQARPNSGLSVPSQALLSQLRPVPSQAWPTQARPNSDLSQLRLTPTQARPNSGPFQLRPNPTQVHTPGAHSSVSTI